MIELHTIYPVTQETLDFLRDLLVEREPVANISHKMMPSRSDHADYVCSMPHRKWWIVYSKSVRVGAVYLSKQNEIGIQISKEHQGNGFGPAAVRDVIRMFPGERLLANVAPLNDRSHQLFQSVGGRVISHTYEILS